MRAFRRTYDSGARASARIPRHVNYPSPQRRNSWGFTEGAPISDALALVRTLPHTVRSFAYVKAASKMGLFARFERYWLELRGNVVLLIFDNAAWAASRTDRRENVIAAVFSVLKCDIVQVRSGKYPVLRIRRPPSHHTVWVRFESDDDCVMWEKALSNAAAQRVVGISDFEFISPIGKGASGKVFLVRDRANGEKFAMKVIDKSRVFETRSAFRHALDERLALELVDGHPFFTRLRYAFQTRSNFYLVIDFYEGGDLYQYLRTHRGRLAEPQARIVAAEVALALDHLHSLGFVYRDLKPENVLLDSEGHVRLADFGLCKLLPNTALTSTICGTHTYAAPEMLASQSYGVSVDLWAFGTFLYHILRGRTPYEARDLEQVIANMNNRRIRFSSSTSPELVQIIKKLLDWNPETRLGCGADCMGEVRRDPFFAEVDWQKVFLREPNPSGLFEYASRIDREEALARAKADSSSHSGLNSASTSNTGKRPADSLDDASTDTNGRDIPNGHAGNTIGGDLFSTKSGSRATQAPPGKKFAGSGRGEAASSSCSSSPEKMSGVEEEKRYSQKLSVPETNVSAALPRYPGSVGRHSKLQDRRVLKTSLWDGMVAAAESDDLRNFDMAEWGKVSVDHDEDDEFYGDASLWPISKARHRLEDERMIAGFSYCSTAAPAPLPSHL